MIRRAIFAAGLLAACGGPSTPAPAAPPAPVTPTPVTPDPLPAVPALVFAYRTGQFRMHMQAEASTLVSETGGGGRSGAIVTDSQLVRSDAYLSLSATDDGATLHLEGFLDSLTVTPARVPGAGSGVSRLLLPLAFSGAIARSGHLTLRVARDTTAAGCWSEARTVLDPIHASFPSFASPIQAGSRWRDSVEINTCRLGIPVRVREVRAFVLDSVGVDPAGTRLGFVSYSATTTAAGTRGERTPQMVTLSGRGEARGALRFDTALGIVRHDESSGTYALTLWIEGRERTLTQQGRRRTEVAPRD